MPSGSHAGTPGSHSGGGASFGGGFGGSRSSGHYGSRGNGPHGPGPRGGFSVVIFGRSVGGATALIIAWIVLSIVTLGFGFGFWAMLRSNEAEVNKIKEDYAYYQAMIDTAKKNPSKLIVPAKVTDSFLGGGGKYFIFYEVRDGEELLLSGYTYSVYTLKEATELLNGGEGAIDIAINKYPIDSTTDSITMDFDGRSFKDDGDYIVAMNQRKGIIIGFSIAFVIIAIFIVAIIAATVKEIKKKDEKATKPKPANSEATATEKPVERTCNYCGATLKEGETKCQSCGASVRKK